MGLQAYNARVTDILGNEPLGKTFQPIFYGVELEYEINPKAKFITDFLNKLPPEKREKMLLPSSGEDKNTPLAHFIGDTINPSIKDFCIVKRDGSLKNGIEIVSRPMTIDMHRIKWGDFLRQAPSFGLTVRASCGMHVHVSREALTTLQIAKILSFIHAPANQEFIIAIAGRRPPEKYANISKPKKITDVKKHESDKRNRYDAFNITNGVTIEFRLFKGTLNESRVMTNVEFCAAIVAFTWTGVTNIANNNLETFLKFVAVNRKEYPYLFNFLREKEYFDKSSLKVKPKVNKNVQPIAA